MVRGSAWRPAGRQAGQAAGMPLCTRACGSRGCFEDRIGSPWRTWMLPVGLTQPL